MEKVKVLVQYEDGYVTEEGYLINPNHIITVQNGFLEIFKVAPSDLEVYIKTSGVVCVGRNVPDEKAEETIQKMVDFWKGLDFFTFITEYHDYYNAFDFDYFTKSIR